MGLRLHNTLSRMKDDFVPIDPQNVRMYVCGPTVYDYAHIGNARPMIVFDVLFRLLRHLYGEKHVTYVRNITDVDDKINARAAEEYPGLPLNQAIHQVTERTTRQFHEDVAALGCLPPTVEPRATDHIEEMKAMIETLIARGYAYVAEQNVLFHVAAMKDYGKLSNRTLDEMVAGARVEVAPYKKDPMDFVLWKPSKPGEPAWPSPAGIAASGRPGWHLECSAMSDKWLWEAARPTLSAAGLAHPHEFDIHGGGIDLVFPHHENEIAQSRCAHGTSVMAHTWLHNGFLQVEGEKMSKSLGNFVTIRELLKTDKFGKRPWPGGTLRLSMLKTHYRQPIDWSSSRLSDTGLELNDFAAAVSDSDVLRGEIARQSLGVSASPSDELVEALSDDLNTPDAIASLHLRKNRAFRDDGAKRSLIRDCEFLGVWRPDRIGLFSVGVSAVGGIVANDLFDVGLKVRAALANEDRDGLDFLVSNLAKTGREFETDFQGYVTFKGLGRSWKPEEIEVHLSARAAARKAKNFAEADRIRAELDAMGIALKDSKDPKTGELVTTWEVKR